MIIGEGCTPSIVLSKMCQKRIMQILKKDREIPSKELSEYLLSLDYSTATIRRAKDALKKQNKIIYYSTGNGRGSKPSTKWFVKLKEED